ncbi:MAG TPA: trypsin-like peptidase domain-containing protein [Actinomycetes bacterium]|nr:trypsin-like peptidase domain-containing protein [Actinomycetes bacterium]
MSARAASSPAAGLDGGVRGPASAPDPAADREAAAMDAYSRVVTAVAERLIPSVASLRVVTRVPGGRMPTGSGSGVVITPDGFLLTSAHVVERAAGGSATFADGRELAFDVVGADRLSDLAVIRADGRDLSAATLGNADTLKVGQLVCAIGNPLGFAGSVSAGVVSALGRSFAAPAGRAARLIENVIQTDAALHPGNSGGALANAAAEVVGINTAVVGPGTGQGLGLAVPVNATTRAIVAALMREGRVRRAYLGIAGGSRPLPPRAAAATGRTKAIEVLSVVAGSPAARAGLRPEDIILAVDGAATEDVGELQRLMSGERIDRSVTVEVFRDGRTRRLTVRPSELREADLG